MKHLQYILFTFFITNIIFAPEPIRVEKDNTAKRVKSRVTDPEEIRPIVTKEKPKTTSAIPEKTPARNPHEIDPKTGHSDFEFALKDAYRNRQRNSKMTREESLEHARELYEKAKREHVKTKDFVLHLKDTYTSGRLNDYYGEGKHDEHSKELMKDLETIDPYLAQKFRDSFVDVKQKAKSKSIITAADFTQWLEKNPDYITNPEKFTNKFHEKTPLEDAIELKDPATIEAIIKIAKEHKISSEQLIAPIREKILDLLKADGKDQVTEYLNNINALGVPELTNLIVRNTLRSELEWGLESGNADVAKEALEIALEQGVSLKFLTKPLVDKYKNMTKSANNYLQKIYSLGNDELSQSMYEQITATAESAK